MIVLQKALKWFAVATTIGMLFILLGGALVTKTDSGMGCGSSWPLCHGQLIPTKITPELIIELAHRVVSGVVGLMVLILSVWAWKAIGHIKETNFLAILSVFFLILQGLIGAAAVVWGQSDFVLALHFGISLISFAAVFLLTLLIFEVDRKFAAEKLIITKQLTFHTIAVTIYSYIVVYTGALVRHVDAGLACPDWPLCFNGAFSLPRNMYEWVQMGHRLAAGIIFIWIAYITFLVLKKHRHQRLLVVSWVIAFILSTLQVSSGAIIVATQLNLYISLAHAFFITSLFGVFSYLILLVSRSRNHRSERDISDLRKVT